MPTKGKNQKNADLALEKLDMLCGHAAGNLRINPDLEAAVFQGRTGVIGR
jgi:hypothetical protein